MNDRKDYIIACTDTKSEISEEWQGLKENEFALKVAMSEDPEKDTYHMKLDKANGYVRFKTSGGNDNGRRAQPEAVPAADIGENQGVEARDGRCGTEGPWSEIVDLEDRGIWFSKKQKLGIWRAKEGKDQIIMIMDKDGEEKIIIRNNEAEGIIQLFCKKDIQVIAQKNISLKAEEKITLKATQEIAMEVAGSAHWKLTPDGTFQDVPDNATRHTGFLPGAMIGGGAQEDTGQGAEVEDPEPIDQNKRKPDDRGLACNGSPGAVPEIVVKVCE